MIPAHYIPPIDCRLPLRRANIRADCRRAVYLHRRRARYGRLIPPAPAVRLYGNIGRPDTSRAPWYPGIDYRQYANIRADCAPLSNLNLKCALLPAFCIPAYTIYICRKWLYCLYLQSGAVPPPCIIASNQLEFFKNRLRCETRQPPQHTG